jgi:hypothetical protein
MRFHQVSHRPLDQTLTLKAIGYLMSGFVIPVAIAVGMGLAIGLIVTVRNNRPLITIRRARRGFQNAVRCDHLTFFARKACQVFRQELRYLSLLCYQRAGHETCQRQNYFCERHKLTFR